MDQTPIKLTAAECKALEMLNRYGGAMLISHIAEVNGKDVFGDVVPGMKVFKRLEARGLLFFTEEEPVDAPGDPLDGFTFTPEVYIKDEGKAALKLQ